MKFHRLLVPALLAFVPALVGCSSDDIDNPNSLSDGPKVSFSIGVASTADDASSRAAVLYDEGLYGENQINNVLILIYTQPINVDNSAAGKIVKTIYVEAPSAKTSSSNIDASYYDPSYYPQSDVLNVITVGRVKTTKEYEKTVTIDETSNPLEIGRRYYATAICNMGDLSSTFQGKSLTFLRDYIYNGDLYGKTSKIKEYENFRMSGINETSFIWSRETSSGSALNLGTFLVQRLAARIDVMLGPLTAGTGESVADVIHFGSDYIKLAVYVRGDDDVLTKSTTYDFYLTGMELVNDVDPTTSGTYLIERSSVNPPSYAGAVPVFFDNEGWEGSPGSYKTNATKYVYSVPSKTFLTDYSVVPEGFSTLPEFMWDSSFYYDTGATDNKKNSCLISYMTENTNSSNYTTLRISGHTNATTSSIFQSPASRDIPDGYHEVVGEIPIRHSLNESSDRMRFSVVRNTIYRVRVKVVAIEGKIYFRYYYDSADDDSALDTYDPKNFTQLVAENNGETVTPND